MGENTTGGVGGGLGDLHDDEQDNTQDNMYNQLDISNTVDLQNTDPLVDTPAVSKYSCWGINKVSTINKEIFTFIHHRKRR